ncbi:ATP-binding protein [uncultured Nevskia sp.]|uniref:sensor histidine kinase n=1 Tax=uncultured Nevskia sp. TaxID=228950 RepID=UPI0025E0C8B6|nr:ATP-binding protein [uncultured Nevskia sp.]
MSLNVLAGLSSGLLPHGVCFQLRPDLIWLHVASDSVTAIAYLMIPAALLWFITRRPAPLSFGWAIALFAAFIVLCGISHILDIVTIWKPIYYLQGIEKGLTAAVSLATAVAIIPLVPRLLSMRSPEELAEANQRLLEEIASRELAEEELRRSLTDLNRAVKELEQFAYITSHDLQAPLRTISGFSQLLSLRHRDQLQGDAVEFLDYIDKGARQMQLLIKDLLSLSRVGRADAASITRRPLADTITEALKSLKAEIDRSSADIAFGTLPEIEANHGLLVQLLQNLIGNAIKFQKPDTRPSIRISIERDGDHWLLTVADNGIGIPADQLDNVFAIFRRLHGAETYEGTGIGLAICRKIAAYHGGDITATSDDSGTQFRLRLPVSIAEQRLLPAELDEGVPA